MTLEEAQALVLCLEKELETLWEFLETYDLWDTFTQWEDANDLATN